MKTDIKGRSQSVVDKEEVGSDRGWGLELVGEVVSDKMQKTISVLVFRQVRHEKYGKYLKMSSVMKAHDEKETARIGDKVLIRECRPLSKTKRFRLVRIVEKSKLDQGAS